MKDWNLDTDAGMRELLRAYTVPSPRPGLVLETTRLMREQLACPAFALAPREKWTLLFVAVAVFLSMSVFYTLTVGTILTYALPAFLSEFLRYSTLALTAAGSIMVAGIFMVFCLKQFHTPHLAVAMRRTL